MFADFFKRFKLKSNPEYRFTALFIIIVMLLPIISLGTLAQRFLQNEIRTQVDRQLNESLNLVSYSIESIFQETEQVYNRIIISPEFIKAFQNILDSSENSDSYDTIRINIADETYNASYIGNIHILVLEQGIIGPNIIHHSMTNPINFDAILEVIPTNGGWVGDHTALDLVTGQPSDAYVASYVGPIKDLSSNVIGFIIIDLDFNHIADLFKNRFTDYNNELHLIASDSRDLFTKYDVTSGTSTTTITHYTVPDVIKEMLSSIEKMSSNEPEGDGQYGFELVELDNIREFVAYQQIATSGFSLLAKINYNEAMASVLTVQIWTTVFMIISILLSIVIASLITNTLTTKDKLSVSEERYRLTAEGANDVLWDWHIKEHRLILSKRWWDLMGYNYEPESSDQFWKLFLHPDDYHPFMDKVSGSETILSEDIDLEIKMRHHNNHYVWYLLKGKKVFDENRVLSRIVGTLSDISTRKEQEYRLTYLAYHDPLTDLLNRNGMFNEVSCMLDAKPHKAGIIFLDLDNFKYINDTYGHDIGDRLLVAIGTFLGRLIGKNNIVSRIGGDEFIIFMNNTTHSELEQTAQKLLNTFDHPFDLGDFSCYTSVSIGISIYPEDGSNFTDLLRSADIAMYHAKANGKNRYTFYQPLLLTDIMDRMHIEEKMRKGIKNNEFYVVYQPQIIVETCEVKGYEALIRWKSDYRTYIGPDKFIPIAEETGMIHDLGSFVIDEAFRTLSQLNKKQGLPLNMSINLSVHQLKDKSLISLLTDAAKRHHISSDQVILEITESTLMEDLDVILDRLDALIHHGYRIALDDFGKGYSSLNYLRKLNIHVLKIDKDFIDDIMNKNDARTLATFILKMGRQLHLDIVAEGVETLPQYEYLLKEGCPMIQGYIFSKPLEEDELILQATNNFTDKKAPILSWLNRDKETPE